MQPLLSNLEWSHLIDALKIAIDSQRCLIDSMLCPDPKDDSKKDAADRIEWTAQVARYRQLRRKLLAEERKSK